MGLVAQGGIDLFAVGGGALLAACGWLWLRHAGSTRLRPCWALLLDLFLPAGGFALLAAATARPLFAGAATAALAAGLAYADRAKLKVLAEPVVFTDVFQAFDILRHPRLALPFPRQGRLLCAVAAALGAFAVLFAAEPPAWRWNPWPPLAAAALDGAVILALGGGLRSRIARHLLRGGLRGDPATDVPRFGPLAVLLGYGIVAGHQRAGRQSAAPPPAPAVPLRRPAPAPLVLVQCESFFDARRLHPAIAPGLLPAYDRCRGGSVQWGRLEVPSWGANTVRTEFAVLSGLAGERLGFDRFNPYHRFAGVPVATLAWQLRAEGYRTICLHPFDRRFYGRDRVMPKLGFDRFIGLEGFAGAQRVNGYVADVEVARKAAQIVAAEGPAVFVFAITMENHGPWHAAEQTPQAGPPRGLTLPPGQARLLQPYLRSLRNADAMLQILAEALAGGGRPGMLAFYGDHLPAFGAAFAELGLRDLRTDYFIWSAARGGARRRDLAAHELRGAILEARAQLALRASPAGWEKVLQAG
ncbi:MAG: LTA synthase family protein [Nevskia sp.]|nr:LTA synthase family protein [Nevskia sp.]